MDGTDPEPSEAPTAGDPDADANDADEFGDLDAREAERVRRRDRDAEAERRELLRPGMGKVFKQILDTQVKRGKSASKRHPG